MISKQYCKICDKELVTESRQFGKNKRNTVRTEYTTMLRKVSNSGVCFNNHWFCNECWKDILNY